MASSSTTSSPFVSQDVFRLVVRLESHQALGDVDIHALERTFRVPFGYSDEESLRKRELLARNYVPGPGAYDVAGGWQLDDRESAAFASRTERDAYQLQLSPTRSSTAATNDIDLPRPTSSSGSSAAMASTTLARSILDTPPPLGSFSRCTRGLESERAALLRKERHLLHKIDNDDAPSPRPVQSLLSSQSAVFPRVSKEHESYVPRSDPDMGPGTYDVRRLWDAGTSTPSADAITTQSATSSTTHRQRRGRSDAPSAAVFGASRGKRDVLWSPGYTMPSCAVPEAWNASPHYAKQKNRVMRAAEREKRNKQSAATSEGLAHSMSAPGLATLKPRSTGGSNAGSSINTNRDSDPFEWLRRQPQGEHRVHALAAKYGLLDLTKLQTAAAAHLPSTPSMNDTTLTSASLRSINGSPRLVSKQMSSRHQPLSERRASQQQRVDDEDGGGDDITPRDDDNDEDDTPALSNAATTDTRIAVSCRLPGGMMLRVTLFSRKRVRHLKQRIVQSQKRFTHDEQFDLYTSDGRKLTHLDATLQASGLTSRSLVQVVPCTAARRAT